MMRLVSAAGHLVARFAIEASLAVATMVLACVLVALAFWTGHGALYTLLRVAGPIGTPLAGAGVLAAVLACERRRQRRAAADRNAALIQASAAAAVAGWRRCRWCSYEARPLAVLSHEIERHQA